MTRVRKGEWIRQDLFSGDWDQLLQQMGQLQQDMPVETFLNTYFAEERYALLRSSVQGFAEGYDLVDLRRASTLALYVSGRRRRAGVSCGRRVQPAYSLPGGSVPGLAAAPFTTIPLCGRSAGKRTELRCIAHRRYFHRE